MAYKFKQYGDGFKILGKYEGWHYGIWIDCMPKSFVFLKPINDNDYVFTCVDSIKAHYIDRFCGRIELSWIKCINGKFIEISAEEAQNFWMKNYLYMIPSRIQKLETLYWYDYQHLTNGKK